MTCPCSEARVRIDGPSFDPVLQAMGVVPEVGMSAIRFSVGRGTTQGEIDIVVDQMANILASAA